MSFTTAAAELGITQTALSLHVRSLEADLGCKLFTRASRTLTLTEIGQAYAFSVRRALVDIDLSTTSLFGGGKLQELVVRVPISTATLFLAHRLPDFLRRHPDMSIRLVSNIWAESAGRENVDVELRLGIGEWTDAPVSKISEERIVPIAAGSGSRKSLPFSELTTGPLVQILGFQDMWQKYLSAFGIQHEQGTFCFSVDTTIAAVDIVAAGGGYAMVLERFAETAIESGRSIAIVGEPVPIEQGHFLVGQSAYASNRAATQLFEAWVGQVFS